MTCPKCRGLLVQEEIQEHSGRFQGWRCIQCGLRLDATIVQNRLGAPLEEHDSDTDGSPATCHPELPSRSRTRQKRPSGTA